MNAQSPDPFYIISFQQSVGLGKRNNNLLGGKRQSLPFSKTQKAKPVWLHIYSSLLSFC